MQLRSVASVGFLVGNGTAGNALLLLDAYRGSERFVAALLLARQRPSKS
jgi:hypothetical protein